MTHRLSIFVSAIFGFGMLVSVSPLSGCSGPGTSHFANDGGGGSAGGGRGGAGGSGGISFSDGGGGAGGSAGSHSGPACPSGLECDVACSGTTTTTISGTVYDPAARNPLYNVSVYVPAVPLTPLPPGVPTGSDACSCGALFKSGAVVNTVTDVDGTFKLSNVPVGSSVPLVIQVGKWRRQLSVAVKACQDNPQPDKSIALPSTVASGDAITNMPDIAVSTGAADTLECLMTRIGLPSSEYVAGAGSPGHVHIFSGGTKKSGLGLVGQPESPAMAGAPTSSTDLWATQAQLMPYDIVLLSCESGETYNANPPALEAYLNAGGRAFGSHFHYAWFTGPLDSTQSYSAPSDWGTHLAKWSAGRNVGNVSPIDGVIDTTLNGSTKPFAKGIALQQWLGHLGALGQGGVPSTELSIYEPRDNAVVTTADTPSQPWITSGKGASEATMYFSFDTPVNPSVPPDGGAPQYCGRAVFSDLHVDGDPSTKDPGPPPGGCDTGPLSPQEKALEFMLFDLSSCVIPDSQPPVRDGGLPPPPK